MVAGLDHRPVAGDVAHGGKGVEDLVPASIFQFWFRNIISTYLGSRNSGDTVHAECSDLLGGQSLDQLGVLGKVEK